MTGPDLTNGLNVTSLTGLRNEVARARYPLSGPQFHHCIWVKWRIGDVFADGLF